jgi:hypothetical protein
MRAFVLVAIAIVGVSVGVSAAGAQTWTNPRGRPPLWQIIALDRSGETGWLYGAEDISRDGASKLEADEASADLRSVYADADRNRVWIRAYVAASGNVSADLKMFFFIDTDERSDTGAGADATDLRPEFETDPSAGGYERAIGVGADGMLIGAWRWDAAMSRWTALTPSANAIQIEIESDQDPLRLAGTDHAYVQIAIEHSISGLDASCNGRIFVRSWLDDPPQRAFGDAVLGAAPCRPELDGLGDPEILRTGSCSADKDCPGAGHCREQICVFDYTCGSDVECRSEERCTSSLCVKVVSGTCDDDADCDGLVCDGDACVACSANGNRACADGLACTPSGTCVDPGDAAAGSGGKAGSGDDAGGGSGAEEYPPGKVRGGSFHCAAVSGERVSASWLYAAPLLGLWLRRRREARSS